MHFNIKIKNMNSANLFLNILKQQPKLSDNYFNKIALGNKTEIKYGFVKDSISLTFLITGKPRNKNLSMSKKVNKLFQTNTNLDLLNEYLNEIKNISRFFYAPYLKINEKPETYAFRISIDHNIN